MFSLVASQITLSDRLLVMHVSHYIKDHDVQSKLHMARYLHGLASYYSLHYPSSHSSKYHLSVNNCSSYSPKNLSQSGAS